MQQQKNNKYFADLDCSDEFQENTAPVAKILHTKFLDGLNSGRRASFNKFQTSIKQINQFSDDLKIQSQLDFNFEQILSFDDFSFSQSLKTDSSENSEISQKKKINSVGQYNYTDSLLIYSQIDRRCDETQKSISLLSGTNNLIDNQEKSQVISCCKMNKNTYLIFANGSIFQGVLKNNKMDRGIYRLQDVFEYEGQFQNDHFHGFDKLILASGFSIEGIWENGKPVGQVSVRYPMGQIYEGQLVHFKKQGKGILFFTDGSIYQGNFEEGQITGQGIFYDVGGEALVGEWIKGQFIGNIKGISQPKINNIVQKGLLSERNPIEIK